MMITDYGLYITPSMRNLFKSSPQCKFMTTRCFLGCPVWEQANHHFPNFKKNHDRFKAWVEAIDRKLETEEDYEYFRTKRLCHIHFKPIFCYTDRRLCPVAIPTLYLTQESRYEYWSKDLELRISKLQSNSPQEEVVKVEADRPKGVAETPKGVAEAPKGEVKTKCEEPLMDVPVEISPSINIQKSLRLDVQESLVNSLIADILGDENVNKLDDVEKKVRKKETPMIDLSAPSPVQRNIPSPVADIIITYYPTIDVSPQKFVMEHLPRDITKSKVVEKLAPEPISVHNFPVDSTLLETYAEEVEIKSTCIRKPKKKRKNILEDENVNKADDVQKQERKKEKPMTDLSAPSPVQTNVPSPAADIIFEYVPTTDVSPQKFVMEHIPRDITKSEVVENLAPEPTFTPESIFIHDFLADSTLLETYAEEVEIKSTCVRKPKKKRKSKYDGVTWDLAPRVPMEHNYSKASIVDSTSHISSNGVHPKNTIITLKRQVRDLRKKLMFYKQKCKNLLLMNHNQQTVTNSIKSKRITKISQKVQSHKKAYKNVRKCLKLKNVGSIQQNYVALDLY